MSKVSHSTCPRTQTVRFQSLPAATRRIALVPDLHTTNAPTILQLPYFLTVLTVHCVICQFLSELFFPYRSPTPPQCQCLFPYTQPFLLSAQPRVTRCAMITIPSQACGKNAMRRKSQRQPLFRTRRQYGEIRHADSCYEDEHRNDDGANVRGASQGVGRSRP